MNKTEKQKSAKQFAEAWKNRGYEKGDARIFWAELLRDVLGGTSCALPPISGYARKATRPAGKHY